MDEREKVFSKIHGRYLDTKVAVHDVEADQQRVDQVRLVRSKRSKLLLIDFFYVNLKGVKTKLKERGSLICENDKNLFSSL